MKTFKQRAKFIKLKREYGDCEDYFIHIGGVWHYAGNTKYRSYLVPCMSHYIKRNNKYLRHTEKELEEGTGRKINFKKESFIHEWESLNLP